MRPRTDFFLALSEAAERGISPRTIERVLADFAGVFDADGANDPRLEEGLREIGHRLGFTLTAVRPRVDEAVALIRPGEPVLLVLQDEGLLSLALLWGTEGSSVRVGLLRAGRFAREAVRIEDLERHLGLDSGTTVVRATRIEAMGRESGAAAAPAERLTPLRRLWSFASLDRAEISVVVGFAVAVGALGLAAPIAVQSLVNYVAFGGIVQPLVLLALVLLFFLSTAGALIVLKSFVVEILQRKMFVRVVSDMSVRLPRVRVDAFDTRYGPEVVNRFMDVAKLQKAAAGLLIGGMDVVLQTVIGLFVLAFYHPFLLLFAAILIGVILLVVFGLGRGGIRTATRESATKYHTVAALQEIARSPVTYRLAGAPAFARSRLAELADEYLEARRAHYRVVLRQIIGAVTLQAVAHTALLTLGGWLVMERQLTLGQLVAAELIVSVALASFAKAGKQFEEFYDICASVDKVGVLYDLPTEPDLGESHDSDSPGAELELRDVGYGYNGHRPLLRGVSFLVPSGRRVVIRGAHASGKSTLADLACGLREPTEGVVLFDGIDVREIAKDSLRLQLNLVKGLELIDGDVIDNVRLGRSDVTIDQVREALSRLGILEELLALPDGLRTEISQSGAPLSEGTGKLLMLARAIVGGPRCVVVDGTLDDLDGSARARALEGLGGEDAPWTLLVFTCHPRIGSDFDDAFDLDGPEAPGAIAAVRGGAA